MMDVMEAVRTQLTPYSGHPGESRDPGIYATRLVTCTEDYVRPRPLPMSPYEASSNWIPAFAGMSGGRRMSSREIFPNWIPDQVRDDRLRGMSGWAFPEQLTQQFIQPAKLHHGRNQIRQPHKT